MRTCTAPRARAAWGDGDALTPVMPPQTRAQAAALGAAGPAPTIRRWRDIRQKALKSISCLSHFTAQEEFFAKLWHTMPTEAQQVGNFDEILVRVSAR